MIWLFVALVTLLFVVLAGRAHSRHLDALEARWRSPSPENWEHLRARWNNVRRYGQLLQTELTERERRHIERRLKEERSAIESITSSTAPLGVEEHAAVAPPATGLLAATCCATSGLPPSARISRPVIHAAGTRYFEPDGVVFCELDRASRSHQLPTVRRNTLPVALSERSAPAHRGEFARQKKWPSVKGAS
jgi:hypothetical protein